MYEIFMIYICIVIFFLFLGDAENSFDGWGFGIGTD